MEFAECIIDAWDLGEFGAGEDLFEDGFVPTQDHSKACMCIWLEKAGQVLIKVTKGGVTRIGPMSGGQVIPANTPWGIEHVLTKEGYSYNIQLGTAGEVYHVKICEGV